MSASGTKYTLDPFIQQKVNITWNFDFSAGTVCTAQLVIFENPDNCALKGSSVDFRCSYNYSEDETITGVAWYRGVQKDLRWIRLKLADFPSLHNRSEYLGDMQHNCSLAIHDLQENDTGHYYFHFDTDAYGRRTKTSVYLSVTGKITVPSVSPFLLF